MDVWRTSMREICGWMFQAGVIAVMLSAGSASWAADFEVNLGRPATEAELQARSITVFPDGRNLPAGHGSPREGAELYRERCAACHGAKGVEGPAARLVGSDGFASLSDPLRILRIRKYPLLVMSVGAQWPHATTIFDYVRRAMPHTAPKSLTHNEVYAITAHILHLNGLIRQDTVLDRESLPRIDMPGRSRSVDVWLGE